LLIVAVRALAIVFQSEGRNTYASSQLAQLTWPKPIRTLAAPGASRSLTAGRDYAPEPFELKDRIARRLRRTASTIFGPSPEAAPFAHPARLNCASLAFPVNAMVASLC
jgi:hypothetical protein